MMVQTSETDIDFSVARPGTNIILVAEEKEIHVNKEFISAFSPYFNTLLQSPNFFESSSLRVDIDHKYTQLLKCIQIVHGAGPKTAADYFTMTLEQVEELLQSADRFDLPVVRRYCEFELTNRKLQYPHQAVEIFLLASQYKLQNKDFFLRQTTANDWIKWRTRTYESKDYMFINTHERHLNFTMQDLISIFRRFNIQP